MNNLHHSALERYDIKRYPVEIDKVSSRDGMPSAGKGPALSFLEVMDQVRQERSSDAVASEPKANGAGKSFSLWEKADAAFGDFLDIINPLHHIPIVATFYRNMTGDKIGFVSRVVGGALWGRLGGLVAGVVNAVVDWVTGKDLGDHIYAAVFSDPSKTDAIVDAPVQNAAAQKVDGQHVEAALSHRTGDLAVSGTLFEDAPIIVPDTDASSPDEGRKEARALKPHDQEMFDRSWAMSSYVRNRVLPDLEEAFRIRHRA